MQVMHALDDTCDFARMVEDGFFHAVTNEPLPYAFNTTAIWQLVLAYSVLLFI